MLPNRYKPPAMPSQSANRQKEAQVISQLVASQHLSEAHNGAYARTLIWTIMAGLAIFFIWAGNTPVYEIVSGNGTIRPEGLSTRIEHRDGGIITQISVADGDRISAGEVIARIDTADLQAEKQKLQANLDGLNQNIARYEWILALDLSGPLEELARSPASQISPTFREEMQYRVAQIMTLRAQRHVARTQRGALEAQMQSSEAEIAILQGQLDRYRRVDNTGLISLSQMEDLRREVIRLESNMAQLGGDIAVQTATVQQMQSSEAELMAENRRDATLQLAEKQQQRLETLQSIAQIADRLSRSVMRAPVSGIVTALAIQNTGEVLAPGEIVAEIIPENTRAFAEIEIPADRIGGVQVGRLASMKVLTYDFTRFGDIPAVVERISPTSFVKQNGEVVFRVHLSFAQNPMTQRTKQGDTTKHVSPGMTVVADIKSEQRTILSFLLKPIRVISDRALSEA